MIGNDIVDLAKAKEESNIFRPRYLEKVCSTTEVNLVLSNANSITNFWRIWTMKECAYKAFQRKFSIKTIFNPFAFTCQFEDSEFGRVSFQNYQLSVETIQTDEFIYSEVINSKINQRFFGSTLDFLLDLKTKLNLQSLPEVSKTTEGFPVLNLPNKTLHISKTHHGKFQVYLY
ncbi:MAG: 4'-phosphopantetheinyl transferase superfamily protein [Psychroflexus sp.]